MFEIYRITLESADQNHATAKTKIKMSVLAICGRDFIGEDNERRMREVANVSSFRRASPRGRGL